MVMVMVMVYLADAQLGPRERGRHGLTTSSPNQPATFDALVFRILLIMILHLTFAIEDW